MTDIPKVHIPAGRFTVQTQAGTIFQACLGTCLGVALYDRVKKAGGLIHILLPEPLNSSCDTVAPEKYASTGLPMLINTLTQMGCTPGNMEATIAGGALVGPVSRLDMGLDIGGRSADIARRILEDQGISIIQSETGGFFTCTLELNMKTGQAEIFPSIEGVFTDKPVDSSPINPRAILSTMKKLKPIPQTALKILRMFNQDRCSIEDITQELSRDQVLSAQTLKICNSAFFSGALKIDTLKDAVLVMGKEMLVKTVITAAVEKYFDQLSPSGYSLCKGGLFFHAVGVASLAERLAGEAGFPQPFQAYTAGLLHDIGKVVLDQYISDNNPLFFRSLEQKGQEILQTEKTLLGFTHCRAGGLLAEKWHFSQALTEAIRFHHTPEKAKNHSRLVDLVYLSDLIMEKFFTRFTIENIGTLQLAPIIRKTGLDGTSLSRCIDGLPLDALYQTHETDNVR